MKPVKPDVATDITTALREVEASIGKLFKSGLAKRAILILIRDSTNNKVSLEDIGRVLEAAKNLGADYTVRK